MIQRIDRSASPRLEPLLCPKSVFSVPLSSRQLTGDWSEGKTKSIDVSASRLWNSSPSWASLLNAIMVLSRSAELNRNLGRVGICGRVFEGALHLTKNQDVPRVLVACHDRHVHCRSSLIMLGLGIRCLQRISTRLLRLILADLYQSMFDKSHPVRTNRHCCVRTCHLSATATGGGPYRGSRSSGDLQQRATRFACRDGGAVFGATNSRRPASQPHKCCIGGPAPPLPPLWLPLPATHVFH
jgi:hypothetical protein